MDRPLHRGIRDQNASQGVLHVMRTSSSNQFELNPGSSRWSCYALSSSLLRAAAVAIRIGIVQDKIDIQMQRSFPSEAIGASIVHSTSWTICLHCHRCRQKSLKTGLPDWYSWQRFISSNQVIGRPVDTVATSLSLFRLLLYNNLEPR